LDAQGSIPSHNEDRFHTLPHENSAAPPLNDNARPSLQSSALGSERRQLLPCSFHLGKPLHPESCSLPSFKHGYSLHTDLATTPATLQPSGCASLKCGTFFPSTLELSLGSTNACEALDAECSLVSCLHQWEQLPDIPTCLLSTPPALQLDGRQQFQRRPFFLKLCKLNACTLDVSDALYSQGSLVPPSDKSLESFPGQVASAPALNHNCGLHPSQLPDLRAHTMHTE